MSETRTKGEDLGFAGASDFLRCQLSLLDAYEKLLESKTFDSAELNEVLKSTLSTCLSLMKGQSLMREQLLVAHRQMLSQYREMLEQALENQGKAHAEKDA